MLLQQPLQRAPFTLRWQQRKLELGRRTCIMGVLNVTPDSFSDGGLFFTPEDALTQAERMVAEGVDIIDVGGESTRPYSQGVSAEEEMRRVLPVIEALAGKVEVPLSIDTTKAAVAQAAIAAGASIINDISALTEDSDMVAVAAAHEVLVVLMHRLDKSQTMQVNPQYPHVVWNIGSYLADRVAELETLGLERHRLIVDPGIGFGKTVQHNRLLLRHLAWFQSLGVPLLIGPSRKSFIRLTLAAEPYPFEVDAWHLAAGTQAMVAAAILGGAHIVRVHDVAATRVTAKCIDALFQDS